MSWLLGSIAAWAIIGTIAAFFIAHAFFRQSNPATKENK